MNPYDFGDASSGNQESESVNLSQQPLLYQCLALSLGQNFYLSSTLIYGQNYHIPFSLSCILLITKC